MWMVACGPAPGGRGGRRSRLCGRAGRRAANAPDRRMHSSCVGRGQGIGRGVGGCVLRASTFDSGALSAGGVPPRGGAYNGPCAGAGPNATCTRVSPSACLFSPFGCQGLMRAMGGRSSSSGKGTQMEEKRAFHAGHGGAFPIDPLQAAGEVVSVYHKSKGARQAESPPCPCGLQSPSSPPHTHRMGSVEKTIRGLRLSLLLLPSLRG